MVMIRGRHKLLLVIASVLIFLFAAPRISVGSWSMLAMWPALEVLHAPAQWWEASSQWFRDRQTLQTERLDFQKKAQQQAALVQEANSLREENRQLRKILDIVGIRGYHWHAAKVRGRSPETMSQRILIQVDGASVDDVIVSSEGLVGRCRQHIRTSCHSAYNFRCFVVCPGNNSRHNSGCTFTRGR